MTPEQKDLQQAMILAFEKHHEALKTFNNHPDKDATKAAAITYKEQLTATKKLLDTIGFPTDLLQKQIDAVVI